MGVINTTLRITGVSHPLQPRAEKGAEKYVEKLMSYNFYANANKLLCANIVILQACHCHGWAQLKKSEINANRIYIKCLENLMLKSHILKGMMIFVICHLLRLYFVVSVCGGQLFKYCISHLFTHLETSWRPPISERCTGLLPKPSVVGTISNNVCYVNKQYQPVIVFSILIERKSRKLSYQFQKQHFSSSTDFVITQRSFTQKCYNWKPHSRPETFVYALSVSSVVYVCCAKCNAVFIMMSWLSK